MEVSGSGDDQSNVLNIQDMEVNGSDDDQPEKIDNIGLSTKDLTMKTIPLTNAERQKKWKEKLNEEQVELLRKRNLNYKQEKRQKIKDEKNKLNLKKAEHWKKLYTSGKLSQFKIGKMDSYCKACSAKHFKEEKVIHKDTFNDCCNHGKIELKVFDEYPIEWQKMFTANFPEKKSFF